jgi:hypothetical protein
MTDHLYWEHIPKRRCAGYLARCPICGLVRVHRAEDRCMSCQSMKKKKVT